MGVICKALNLYLSDPESLHSILRFLSAVSSLSSKISIFRDYPDWMPFCHIWYNDSAAPVVSQVSEVGEAGYPLGGYPHVGDKENLLDAFLFSCRALEAREDRIPVSVSLLQSECPETETATNNLRIHYQRCVYL